MVESSGIPDLYDIVERPRLFKLLDQHTINKQVILITGQPAQGKSTLIASYLKKKNEAACWLHLDRTESDHNKLFYKIINGVVHALKSDKKIKAFKIPQITLGAGEDVLRYSDILYSLFSLVDIKLNIVFDDLESIEEKESGFDLIRRIIKILPRNIRCFMLSRQEPCLRINTLKMEEKFFVLTNKDLAFTLDETILFFNRNNHKKEIGKKQFETIHKNTEGWAGGLTLISESLRRSGDISLLPHNLSFNAFSYFSREIYENQPRHIRDFLIKTSIFDTMDPEVLSSFWDITDVLSIFEYLEKRNLFIQKIESGKKWPFFRYNNLFRDFLKRDLLRRMDYGEYVSLNNDAGKILKKHCSFEEAVECFYSAENFLEIAGIIKIKATDLLIKGRIGVIKSWLQLLPEKNILSDPWLLFYRTMTRRIKGGKKNISSFKNALELFVKNKNIRGEILCIAYLIEAAVFLRKPSGTITCWIKKGEAVLKGMPSGRKYTWARAVLWQQIGLGYIAGCGEIPKGISACKNAGILAAGINNTDIGLNSAIIMIFGYVQAGDFSNAKTCLEKIDDMMIKQGQNPEYRALKNLIDIDFSMKKGNFDETGKLLTKSESDIEKFGLIFLYPVFIELKALYYIYIKNHEAAMQMADHLSDFSILEGNYFYRGISHRLKAVAYIHKGLYEKAEKEAEKAIFLYEKLREPKQSFMYCCETNPGVNPDRPHGRYMEKIKSRDIHFFMANQIFGFTMMYNGNYIKAAEILEKSCRYFKSVSHDLLFTETCFALGIVFWEMDDKEKSEKFLKQGIFKSMLENYINFPCLNRNEIIKALFLSFIFSEDEKTEKKIKQYFKSFIPFTSSEKIVKIISKTVEKIDKKDQHGTTEQLKTFYTLSLPKLKIHTLGKFTIYKGDKELYNIEWGGTRPKLLLKSIILNGARNIPREILIDNLWPDSSSKAGAKNFKINLYRLRKALEPAPKKIFGYSYIIHRQGLISLNPELVSLDIDDFFKFCLRGEKREKNDDIRGAIENYTKAAEIYKGDYFTEEPYMDWLARRRDLIRNKYISILQKKAMLHEEINEIDQAVEAWQNILCYEPFYEDAYRNLMIIYADSGYMKKSINIFKKCSELFKKELDSKPDAETSALYNRIKQQMDKNKHS